MTENTNPFEFLDFDADEAKQVEKEIKERGRYNRDGRICACGHPMGRHTVERGAAWCKPSKMDCLCTFENMRAVIDTDDVRDFLRKTVGSGPMHALGRGILAAMEKSHRVTWLIEQKCDRCKVEGPISPVPVSQRGFAMFEGTGYDVLLCRKCREVV